MKNMLFILSLSFLLTNCATNSNYAERARTIASGKSDIFFGRLAKVVKASDDPTGVTKSILKASETLDGKTYESISDMTPHKQNEIFYKILNNEKSIRSLNLRKALKNYVMSSEAETALKNALIRSESKVASQLGEELLNPANKMEAALAENLIANLMKKSTKSLDEFETEVYYLKKSLRNADITPKQREAVQIAWLTDLETRIATNNELSAIGAGCEGIISKIDKMDEMNLFIKANFDPNIPIKDQYYNSHIASISEGEVNETTLQAAKDALLALGKLDTETHEALMKARAKKAVKRTPAEEDLVRKFHCNGGQNVKIN
mgnify:CR=1 FL=1